MHNKMFSPRHARISVASSRRHPFLLVFFLLLLAGCSGPVPTETVFDEIDTSQEPLQTPSNPGEPFTLETKHGIFTLRPVAEYKASVMVVGKEPYFSGWSAEISPIDLAVEWGKLADPAYDKYISYSQSDRWYFYEYKQGSPFTNSYIISHSSNNHIIPATENVLKAMKSVRKKQKLVIEGLLVNITGTYEGQRVWWNSSLSRTDTGAGSCELFYVSKVRIEDKVYQ